MTTRLLLFLFPSLLLNRERVVVVGLVKLLFLMLISGLALTDKPKTQTDRQYKTEKLYRQTT